MNKKIKIKKMLKNIMIMKPGDFELVDHGGDGDQFHFGYFVNSSFV